MVAPPAEETQVATAGETAGGLEAEVKTGEGVGSVLGVGRREAVR